MQGEVTPLGMFLIFIGGIIVGRFLTQFRQGLRKKPGEERMSEFMNRLERMRDDHRAAIRLVQNGDASGTLLLQRLEFELGELGSEAQRVRADILKG